MCLRTQVTIFVKATEVTPRLIYALVFHQIRTTNTEMRISGIVPLLWLGNGFTVLSHPSILNWRSANALFIRGVVLRAYRLKQWYRQAQRYTYRDTRRRQRYTKNGFTPVTHPSILNRWSTNFLTIHGVYLREPASPAALLVFGSLSCIVPPSRVELLFPRHCIV
jgi:hypothetical protein